MLTVKKISARQILDSRGTPTLETTLTLSDDRTVSSSVPSGASVGSFEAVELRDGDNANYSGKSVLKAVNAVNTIISSAILGKDVNLQKEVDKILIDLDGTENKSKLGANAILSVSIAITKAGAVAENKPLFKYLSELSGTAEFKMPRLLANLINGGMHAGWNLDFQEFIAIPTRATSIKESLMQLSSIYSGLKNVLVEKGGLPLVGDEGGFAPKFGKNEDALYFLDKITKDLGFIPGNDIFLGLDAAASSFFKNDTYKIRDRGDLSGTDLLIYYKSLFTKYPMHYLEDPFAEGDIASWEKIIAETPESLIVTGDDLTVTNSKRLDEALEKKLIRGIVVKPNQIGTVTEALSVCRAAKKAGISVIVSHRSGETNDDFISDFAIGVGADFVKFGAPARGERVAKYNRLLKIEEDLM